MNNNTSSNHDRYNGTVLGTCSECGAGGPVRADAWKGEGSRKKPRCVRCGGLVYASDQTSCITPMGVTIFGVNPALAPQRNSGKPQRKGFL